LRTTVFWGHNRGEVIMGQIHKATAAAIALTITLMGATLVTAPMTLSDSQRAVAHAHQWSANHLHHIATDLRYAAAAARV
jgi:hypothetical protein